MAVACFGAAMVTGPSVGQADDWLADYPECAFGPVASALGEATLLYPRTGLVAVVSAGRPLVLRVRVPSALTPPPGHQQDAALIGWSGSLRGNGVSTDVGPVEHRYRLRVTNVRPDGPSSLVYRATILVPQWAAPGTYTLQLSVPGGDCLEYGAVRVLGAESLPRVALGRPPADGVGAWLGRLAVAPVDVTFVPASVPLYRTLSAIRPEDIPALVVLPREGLPIALRADGSSVAVLGGCERNDRAWVRRVRAIARAEGRSVVRLPSFPAAPGSVHVGGSPLSLPEVRYRTPFAVEATQRAEVTLLSPLDIRPLETYGAVTLGYYPATDVEPAGTRPTLAMRVTLVEEAPVQVVAGPSREQGAAIQVSPDPVAAGQRATLSLDGPARAMVAWRLGEDATATGPVVSHHWSAPEPHPIVALVVDPDARATLARTEVRVVPRHGEVTAGCDAAGEAVGGFLWICALLLLQKRRCEGPARKAE